MQTLMLAAHPGRRFRADHTARDRDGSLPRAMFDILADVSLQFCVPLGYPVGRFGPNVRKPTAQTSYLNRWDAPVPWAT